MMPSRTMVAPAGADRALGQRHQRERAALAVVVGAEQDHDVFERHHDDERPQDQGEHAEHGRRRSEPVGARGGRRHGLAERVERTGADVAIDHADAAERQRAETGRGVGLAMAIGRRRFRGGNCYVACHGRARWPLKMLHCTTAEERGLIVLRCRHSLARFWALAMQILHGSANCVQMVTWVPTSTTRPVGIWK
ncbi:hypothetical protein ACVMHR_004424 [Bradyrhizobium diazoefficiens]